MLYGDALDILDDKLYVTQNFANHIGVFQLQLNGHVVKATLLGNLTSADYDTPATSALYDGYIYSTNSRFEELVNISAPADNNIVGVKNTFAGGSNTIPPPSVGTSSATAAAFVPSIVALLALKWLLLLDQCVFITIHDSI